MRCHYRGSYSESPSSDLRHTGRPLAYGVPAQANAQ